jgi:hypothetical protein
MIPDIDVTAQAVPPPIAAEAGAEVMGTLLFKIVTEVWDRVEPYRNLYT